MNRRYFTVGFGALIAGAVAPSGAMAQPGTRSVDAKRVFDRLLDYYSLAAAERSRFTPVYTLKAETGPAPSLFLETNGVRRSLSLEASGRVLDPPTPAELKAGAQVVVAGQTKMSSTISMEPVLTLGLEIAASDARTAIDQANAAVGKFAGLLGFMAPRVSGVAFIAAREAAGSVVLASGQASAMPYADNRFEFRPSAATGAKSLKFLSPPSAAIFLN